MRKIISWLVAVVSFVFMSNANAELHVDVVAGGVDPISIAVQKF